MKPHALDELRRLIVRAGENRLSLPEIMAEIPPEFLRRESDVAVAAGFLLAKKNKGGKPLDLVGRLLENIPPSPLIEKGSVHPPGYLNLKLSSGAFLELIDQILTQGDQYPQNFPWQTLGVPDQVLLEFCSANPTGPLHFGHARGSVLGDTLARIWRHLGVKVTTEHYINDIGTQIERLGASLSARYQQEVLGRPEAAVPQDGYHGDYLKTLAKKLPSGLDPADTKKFAELGKEELLGLIKGQLKELGIRFDLWSPESALHENGKVTGIIEDLKRKGYVAEKDGALWFTAKGLSEEDKERVLKRSDGRTTYFASDLAYHQDKFSRAPSGPVINIWGADHHGYVPRMKLGIEALGLEAKRFEVILVQMVRLFRAGQPVTLSKRAGETMTPGEIIEEVGLDALRFFLNARSPNAQLDFDLDLAKKTTPENPVYLIQYAHARICSIEREKATRGVSWPQEKLVPGSNFSLENDPKTRELAVSLLFFSEALLASALRRSPHHLASYLIDLARTFNGYYETHPVLAESSQELAFGRFRLCLAAKQILATGLNLLGVSHPERM
ncbi:MAG: arginine--tRNA ligase [Elusimicrobia bacterium]|nr:arginine--tRNA ligase [Elusimicrobiota bacterium]